MTASGERTARTDDARLDAALRPFRRRAIRMEFLRSAMVTLPVAALAVEISVLTHAFGPRAGALLVAAAVAVSAAWAAIARPTMLTIARRIDRRANLHDLIVTAIGGADDGMSTVVRARAVAQLTTYVRRVAFPIEPPRQWRRWVAGALVSQAVALAFLWQAPAARAVSSGLSSIALPPNGSTSAPTPHRDQNSASVPAPSAPTDVTTTTPTPAQAGGVLAPAITSTATALPSNGAGDRIRLAAADADADISAGRIPVSRRAMVERYFAALQSVRKPSR